MLNNTLKSNLIQGSLRLKLYGTVTHLFLLYGNKFWAWRHNKNILQTAGILATKETSLELHV
jgi:hypothetical protein